MTQLDLLQSLPPNLLAVILRTRLILTLNYDVTNSVTDNYRV